jgi:hypothetical protein
MWLLKHYSNLQCQYLYVFFCFWNNCIFNHFCHDIYRTRKNFMPKLREVGGRDENKHLLSRRCMSEMRPCKLGLNKFGNRAKPLKDSEEKSHFLLI